MTDEPEYKRRLRLAVAKGVLAPSGLSEVEVSHDEDCSHTQGGICDCDPEIIIYPYSGGRPFTLSKNGEKVEPIVLH